MRDEIINMKTDVVMISARQKGLMKAVSLILPNGHHRYYPRHFGQNPYRVTRDNMAQKYIWATAL